NAIWLWGHGTKPQLTNFEALYGVKGAMVSAVDLLKGIARLNGMTVCEVDGATGYIDTNFEGKRDAALKALQDGHELVYIHLEAPDE
ncbi:MAG: phosphoglycerate mutase, partial [Clostridia bacterium]|nr:phosphoglycerate mutase [Clostridia bacterium]